MKHLRSLKQMFIQNKTLIHCDFSHCGFSEYECQVMNEGLKRNHTILGIHMVGNKMNIDPLGFIKAEELALSVMHVSPRISNSLKTGLVTGEKLYLNACSN